MLIALSPLWSGSDIYCDFQQSDLFKSSCKSCYLQFNVTELIKVIVIQVLGNCARGHKMKLENTDFHIDRCVFNRYWSPALLQLTKTACTRVWWHLAGIWLCEVKCIRLCLCGAPRSNSEPSFVLNSSLAWTSPTLPCAQISLFSLEQRETNPCVG